ncbi:MAG: hypothetical protein JNK40_02250 [Chromatiales bacterium]|nr:hypothetical protein [Chromatiales bacterium]
MPTVWENSHVDQLQTLFGRKDQVQRAVLEVRHAVEPLIGPDAAKVLVAIAADVMTGVQARNNRADVNDACAGLRRALVLLEAINSNLDG